MTAFGIILFSALVLAILYRYFTAERPYGFPREGYVGAAILITGEVWMFAGVEPIATYFTAIAWTGYILWADAAVYSIRGKSLRQTYPAEFAALAVCSIPLWLIFEAYNLRLDNWVYVGLPRDALARNLGYAWAFATIWPGIFETAALLRAVTQSRPNATAPAAKNNPLKSPPSLGWAGLGLLLLVLPVVLPPGIGSYLFGAVWLGFIFLLEPVNYRMGRESLWRDLQHGDRSRLVALLAAGFVCGILWEFWNWWATARWVYVFPMFQDWKLFAMPLPGYLGFPPFAVECFAMFAFLAPILDTVLRKLGVGRIRREALGL